MKTPWASIARIEVGGKHSGTGFLVTPNHVLPRFMSSQTRPANLFRALSCASTRTPNTAMAARYGRPAPTLQRVFGVWTTTSLCFNATPRHHPGPSLSAIAACSEMSAQRRDSLSKNRPALPQLAIFPVRTIRSPVARPSASSFNLAPACLLRVTQALRCSSKTALSGCCAARFWTSRKRQWGASSLPPRFNQSSSSATGYPGLLTFRPPILWPNGVSADSPILADRKEEFAIFRRMITGATKKRVLLLQGESGSGKTVLTNELTDYARQLGLHVAKADCKGTPPLDSVFTSLLLDVPGVLPEPKPPKAPPATQR